jgi:hypothetical protein
MIKLKTKKCHNGITVPKSKREMVEKGKLDTKNKKHNTENKKG